MKKIGGGFGAYFPLYLQYWLLGYFYFIFDKESPWPKPLLFTDHATRSLLNITSASKTILRLWNRSMTNGFQSSTDFFGPMWVRSFIDIWIAVFCITALPGSNAESVGMNFYWRFRASVGIFVRPVIRSGSWNSVNGFAMMSSRQSHTGISCSVYRNFFDDSFFTIENCFPT